MLDIEKVTQEWIDEFFKKGKPLDMRNELITRYLPVIKTHTTQLYSKIKLTGVDFDDLFSDACQSVIQQINSSTKENLLMRICSLKRIIQQGCSDRHRERTSGWRSPYKPENFMVLECDISDFNVGDDAFLDEKISTEIDPYIRVELKEKRKRIVKILRQIMPAKKAANILKHYRCNRPRKKKGQGKWDSNKILGISNIMVKYIKKNKGNKELLKKLYDDYHTYL